MDCEKYPCEGPSLKYRDLSGFAGWRLTQVGCRQMLVQARNRVPYR